ncbi:DNA polymerase delta subunit 3 isoform X2 [Petromyzon marinus]|uniref:DNA polymerase delta subunit 3 isoform X2 n=1 Tax=Petromyzon marinus TaxID=7757 RepID=UPI003F71054D
MPPATGVDEMYIDNIDEFIDDESRIVTYKWLSYTLQVHVNTAKKMLWEFVRRAREEKPKVALHVTYLVSGVSTLDGLPCHKVSVVREEELESAKAQLSLLASVHVYSVQRARLLDSGMLYMADYDIIRDNLHQSSRFSSIQYSRGVARSTEEMQALRSQATSAQEPSDPLDGPLAAPAAPPAATNGQCAPKATPRAAPPKGIMGMFAGKGGGSKEGKVKKESPAPEPVKEKPAAASVKAPVKVSIFASAAKAKPKEEIKTEVKASVSTEEEKQAKVDDTRGNSSGRVKRPKVSDSEDEEEEKVVAAVESKHAGKKGAGNAGKRAAARDGKKRGASPEAKKRKRIRQPVSDSSSSSDDDDDDDDNDEEQEAPSPPTIGTPPLPEVTEHQQDNIGSEKTEEANKSGARRKRRRVLKSKTFLDEEGSMVTEKDWVSESCTDSEGEFQPATKKAPTVPLPQKAAQKMEGGKGKDKKPSQQSKLGKQTSIMGFFQKK